MTNSFHLFRSLIIYAICLPAAVILGWLLATPEDAMSFYGMILVLALLMVPMLLRWHHFWLIAVWNTQAIVFFVKGSPTVALAMSCLSLGISALQHALNRRVAFINVPEVAKPLIFLALVVIVTARLTGGIGLSIAGSAAVGGKRYIYLLGGVLGYFALSAHRVPLKKVTFYVAVFFLSGCTAAISDMAHFFPPSILYYILLIFPPFSMWEGGGAVEEFVAGTPEITRLGGIAGACSSVVFAMLAVHGIGGIFNLRKFWRAPIFLTALLCSMFGGYRSVLVLLLLTFAAVFWFEGLARSRMLPAMVCFGVLIFAALVPFADRLPLPIQRTLSVVPFVPVSRDAADSAEGSTEWRLRIWQIMYPQVPKYLLLGKGLSINAADLATADISSTGDAEGSIMAGDYHSGTLSVIIPFGAAGAIGFLWLIWAGIKVLYNNYRHGDPSLRRINTFLLASFIARTIFFFAVFGSLVGDLVQFTGLLGLSIAINGGVCKPEPAPEKTAINALKLAPAHAEAIH